MKSKRLLNMIGEIDDRYIADAAPIAKRTRKPLWVKLGAAAACLVLAAAAGIMILKPGGTSLVLIGGIAREYGNSRIVAGSEVNMEWPWEYKTLAERYTTLMIGGREYVSTGRTVDSALTGKALGVYDLEGYDPYTGKSYRLRAEVFETGGISAERVVAVKLEDSFYTFINKGYDPPATFGEVLDEYNLAEVLDFNRFSTNEGFRETGYFIIDDDAYIWKVLNDCRDAEFIQDDAWSRSGRDYISFTVTSDALGVYKRVFYVSNDGYISTNIFDYAYLFQIGDEAAEKIISYATQNGTETVFEPYTNTLAGTITDISGGFILVNDSILCKNESDGMTFRIPMEDLRISRCIDFEKIGIGDLVVVSFAGVIDVEAGNIVEGAYSLSKGTLSDGSAAVPE